MNKIEIEIPNNKEIDWEASAKQKQIVFKDKQLTYEDVCNQLFTSEYWYSDSFGMITHTKHANINKYDSNNASTEHQLECILAKNKLANVSRYLNGNWKPGKTDLGHFDAYVLFTTPNKDYIGYTKIQDCVYNSNVLFKSIELAKQAIEILGEETVKLALEPLY
jgi:hypothetical protein